MFPKSYSVAGQSKPVSWAGLCISQWNSFNIINWPDNVCLSVSQLDSQSINPGSVNKQLLTF